MEKAFTFGTAGSLGGLSLFMDYCLVCVCV